MAQLEGFSFGSDYLYVASHLLSFHHSVFNILNKSENATPELFAIYIQNYANQECK